MDGDSADKPTAIALLTADRPEHNGFMLGHQMSGADFLDDPERAKQLTTQYPLGRIATPEEVAEAAVWLCSDVASFVTGEALPVDGGFLAG